MRTEARFPGLKPNAGHYESFFLRAARPSGGQAIWIRYTIDRAPGASGSAKASLWLTWFDRDRSDPIQAKATLGEEQLSFPDDGYIAIGDASLTPGRAVGSVTTELGEATWDLTFDDGADPFDHLQFGWMYGGGFPRTKVRSPYPNSRFSGVVSLGEQRVEIDGWPGMVGHNWGAEHAERWIWIDAVGIDGNDGYLDLAAGRLLVAGRLTPWIANGVIEIDGRRYRLGGFRRIRSVTITETDASCGFSVGGSGIVVSGHVDSRPTDVATWQYDDPSGGSHEVRNGGIADLDLTIKRDGTTRPIIVRRSTTYEVGRREPAAAEAT